MAFDMNCKIKIVKKTVKYKLKSRHSNDALLVLPLALYGSAIFIVFKSLVSK